MHYIVLLLIFLQIKRHFICCDVVLRVDANLNQLTEHRNDALQEIFFGTFLTHPPTTSSSPTSDIGRNCIFLKAIKKCSFWRRPNRFLQYLGIGPYQLMITSQVLHINCSRFYKLEQMDFHKNQELCSRMTELHALKANDAAQNRCALLDYKRANNSLRQTLLLQTELLDLMLKFRKELRLKLTATSTCNNFYAWS